MKVKGITPGAAVPAGILRIEMDGARGLIAPRVEVGDVEAECLGASSTVLTVKVPEDPVSDEVVVYQADQRARGLVRIGRVVADSLHCVANPVVDSEGRIYCTFSGSRGEKVPFSVYVIGPSGDKQPFLAEITNATGLAIGRDNLLYVSSRHSGTIFRSSFDKQVEKFVDGLGLATGIAFDSVNNLLVGDRSGRIYRVTPERRVEVLCELEPSVSAYHLAVAPDDSFFVTGPTLSTQDCIYHVSTDGVAKVFFKGFGRPQGLAFDPLGNVQLAASYRGRKGVYTFRDGKPEWTVSGPMLVGLAYCPVKDRLYLVDNSRLYSLAL